MDELKCVFETYGCNLRTNEREGCLRHNRPPTQEPTLRTANAVILHERARIAPVPEPDTVMVGSSAEIKNDAEDLRDVELRRVEEV